MKRLAVLGHPVSHSRSPAMQNAALEELGLAGEWSYEAIDLAPEEFERGVRALPADGFVGANVTIPHKEAALAIAGAASAAATQIGAANTLSFGEGEIRAENTDAPGLIAALPSSPAGKRALVLGAGGSARAAAWALAGQGTIVDVWNRTGDRADRLVRDLMRGGSADARGLRKEPPVSSGDEPPVSRRGEGTEAEGRIAPVVAERIRSVAYELIVNCTPVGLAGEDPFEQLPIDPGRLDAHPTLVDLVYGGEETALVREARRRGATVVDGLEVLVRQGAESLRIWTGLEPPLDVMREAARAG